jgi:adenylosuccinate lyase
MRRIWEEDFRLNCLFKVEAALARAEEEIGFIPVGAADDIDKAAKMASPARAKQIEEEIGHDMMAVVLAMAEVCKSGEWIHMGATSNDILDTATGLQIQEALNILEMKLKVLLDVLLKRAMETRALVCAGRTHGQIAIPTTYGLRFAIWASEVARHIDRLRELRPRAAVGKISGAVGTQAAFGLKGLEIQKKVMEILGLNSVDVSNQVIQRDRHAELLCFLALVASTLEKIFVEMRTLQRTEIAEVEESFGKRQVGSSTMPHKRNPIKSEQICGLARVIRAQVIPAFENIPLWDERDLTNSSCERAIFPEAFVLADHILKLAIKVIEKLRLRTENVMIELAKRGVGRQHAHEMVRQASMKAFSQGRELAEVLNEDDEVIRIISSNEIKALLNPHEYIGTAIQQVEILNKKLRDHIV